MYIAKGHKIIIPQSYIPIKPQLYAQLLKYVTNTDVRNRWEDRSVYKWWNDSYL